MPVKTLVFYHDNNIILLNFTCVYFSVFVELRVTQKKEMTKMIQARKKMVNMFNVIPHDFSNSIALTRENEKC